MVRFRKRALRESERLTFSSSRRSITSSVSRLKLIPFTRLHAPCFFLGQTVQSSVPKSSAKSLRHPAHTVPASSPDSNTSQRSYRSTENESQSSYRSPLSATYGANDDIEALPGISRSTSH